MSKPIIYEVNSDNKIFNNDSNPSFSKNVDSPKFTLGFQHFIHQSKLKMDITKQFEGKKKIYLVMSEFETIIDDYEQTIQNTSNEYFNPKNPITGRTFYKLWEIFLLFDIIDLEDNNYVTTLLDDNNSNLLRAVMLFRNKFGAKNKNNKYVNTIINNEYVEKNKKNKKGVTEYTIDTSIGKNKVNLIITNGFKSELSPVIQEQESYKLILNQIIYALQNQIEGGAFICKIYESFTNVMSKIVACLTCFYDKVYVIKPLTSRNINSEKYIVCRGFKKITNMLAGFFTGGGVGDAVVVVAAEGGVGPLPLGLDGLLRRLRRDQPVAPADQVRPPGLNQRLADLEVVLRLEELHERPLHLAVVQSLRNRHRLFRERVQAGVIHARRDVERRRDEVLHLIRLVAVLLQIQRQVDHLVNR